MSNLIQYIVQDDPEEELKKKQSQTLLSRELSSRQDTDKNYKFNSRHLLENDFSHLQSKPAPTARSYLSQALAKNVAKEGNKVSSALSPKPIGNDAASYKIAQNAIGNIANKPSVTFDDIYFSTLDADGKVIYKGTDLHEGGLSNRKNDLGGLTNYGVRQDALNKYNNWNAPLKKGTNFPTNVKDLTAKQAKQIMDEMYYQRYNINKLQNLKIARNTFDAEVNQGTDAGKMLSRSMNKFYKLKNKIYEKGSIYRCRCHRSDILNDILR